MAEISGGTITLDASAKDGATLTVTGGTFSKDVTEYCAEGFHTVKEGSMYVYGAHSFSTVKDSKDATCTEDGYVIKSCACGAEHTDTLPKTGHTHADPVRENVVNPTVTSAGSYDSVFYCGVCGVELNRTKIEIPMLHSKIEQEAFTDDTLPETITGTYDTVEELAAAMTDLAVENYEQILTDAGLEAADVKSQLQDVTLMYSTDGENWIKADEEHFPNGGKLEIVMPIPEGTNLACYTFFVTHMFTSDAFNNEIGTVEYPEVREFTDDEGNEFIKFYVIGLSPINLAWAETDPCGLGHEDADGNGKCDGCGESMLLGDLDLDGDVDSDDLTLLARHVAQIEVLTGIALDNADVNGKDGVNADDLTIHARYVARIITNWEEGLGEQTPDESEEPENP